jgi:hypothetical protein
MDNVLSLDAETAAELDCKPGDKKTIEVEISVDKNDAEGLSATVLSVSHYDEENKVEDSAANEEAEPGSAIPASNEKSKTTPKAVKNLMYA